MVYIFARVFLVHAHSVCIVLSDFEFHLLLQRSEGCRGRSSTSQEMSSSDCIWKSLIQKRLRDDGTLSDWLLRTDSAGHESYWLMNIGYCIRLKQIAILDVSIIAIGFVMRVLAGGITTNIWISHWLVMMTFLMALFLAFTKRNDDYRIYEQTGTKPRVSITGYSKTFINEATAIIASVTLVCYIMYTMSPEVIERMGTRYVYLTSCWVLAGLLRYLQNMIVFGLSGSPTKSLVKDHFIQLCVLGWIASFFVIIYL